MKIPENRPYLTAASAARELGYTDGTYITLRCRQGKIPEAYKDGGIWMVPTAWVEARKERDAVYGIVRGTKPGGHVTTGAGLRRKDRGGAGGRPGSTGRQPGRPRKSES